MSARARRIQSILRSGPRSRSAPVLEKSIRSEMPKAQSPLSLQYHSWTQADEYSANIHPRWLEFKEAGNEALKRGDYHAALRLYSEAVTMCDGRLAVGAFFDALNGHPAQSAAQRLAGMRADIMPLIKDCMLCPDLEKGQPNMPAAVCAANRAAANLKLGLTSEAVKDASFAVKLSPEYLKGRHRLKQALLADGRADEAAECASSIRRFEELSKPPPDGGNGLWLGFRLILVGWLNADKYADAYEASRARHWRKLAYRSSCSIASYARLRVHMECFPIAVVGHNHDTGAKRAETWLVLSLTVCSNGLLLENIEDASGRRPGTLSDLSPDHLADLERSRLPSIDYRYLRLVGSLDEVATAIPQAVAAVLEVELPMVTSLSLASPQLSDCADALRGLLRSRGLEREGRAAAAEAAAAKENDEDKNETAYDGVDVCYFAGQPLRHKKFAYRGVIVGSADHTCTQSAAWMRQMGVDELPRGRYQPWYRVLVDSRDRPDDQMTYVCHDNIDIWRDPPTDDDNPMGGPICHPHLRQILTRYDPAKGVYEARDLIGSK